MSLFDYLRHPIDINRPLDKQIQALPPEIFIKWAGSRIVEYHGGSRYLMQEKAHEWLWCQGGMHELLDELRKIIKEYEPL